MVFLARICKKKKLAPEEKGLAPELFLVLSIPDYTSQSIMVSSLIWGS
jgi:hypothetical protein